MAGSNLALPRKARPVALVLILCTTALSLPTAAGAVEIPRVSVPVPRVNIPTPHVHVPTPHINAPHISIHTNTAQAHTPHIKASTVTANNATGTKSTATSTSAVSPNAKPTVTLTSPPPAQKTTTAATTPASLPSLCAATLGCASAPPPPPPQSQTTITIITTNNTCVVVPSNSPNPGSANFNSVNILTQLSQAALVVDEAGSPGPGQLADFADNAIQNLQAGNPGQTQQADSDVMDTIDQALKPPIGPSPQTTGSTDQTSPNDTSGSPQTAVGSNPPSAPGPNPPNDATGPTQTADNQSSLPPLQTGISEDRDISQPSSPVQQFNGDTQGPSNAPTQTWQGNAPLPSTPTPTGDPGGDTPPVSIPTGFGSFGGSQGGKAETPRLDTSVIPSQLPPFKLKATATGQPTSSQTKPQNPGITPPPNVQHVRLTRTASNGPSGSNGGVPATDTPKLLPGAVLKGDPDAPDAGAPGFLGSFPGTKNGGVFCQTFVCNGGQVTKPSAISTAINFLTSKFGAFGGLGIGSKTTSPQLIGNDAPKNPGDVAIVFQRIKNTNEYTPLHYAVYQGGGIFFQANGISSIEVVNTTFFTNYPNAIVRYVPAK